MDLQGVTALVTGGARRVGKAITLGLASVGCNVLIHHGSSDDEAEAAADEAQRLGVGARVVRADLAEDPSAVLEAAGELGPVRALVNSAAVFPEDTLSSVEPRVWEHAFAVNLRAPVLLTRAFAAQLGDEQGAVVNVTDWRTARPYRSHFTYTLTKGALDTFTLAAAEALAPKVRVNAVALGAILPPSDKDAGYLESLADGIPMRRPGGTEPVVDAVLFLLRNDFITGEIVRIDGGAHLT